MALDPDRATCNAKTDDGPCPRPAGDGTPHAGRGCCRWHGGMLPSHRGRALADDLMAAVRDLPSPLPGPGFTLGPEADAAVSRTLRRHLIDSGGTPSREH